MQRQSMVAMTRCLALLLATATASAVGGGAALTERVTPIEKVITLLEDLKAEVEEEASTQASSYDEFACFCKDTTEQKSNSVKEGQDNIESLSAEIADKTAEVETLVAEVEERNKKAEKLAAELVDTKAQYAKEQAIYDARAADLSKAISSCEGAIKALEDSKPSLLQSVPSSVEKVLALADALSLIDTKQKQAVTAFMQVDPSDPEYKFHSQGIIDILEKLLTDFRTEKASVDAEWEKLEKSFKDLIEKLGNDIAENADAIEAAKERIENLKVEIAEARESLVNAEGLLKDDQLYLKDLTKRCEDRAKDWDQRTQLRAEELEALTQALEILQGKVQGLDEDVNKRALLLDVHPRKGAAKEESDSVSPDGSFQLDTPRAGARVLLQVRSTRAGETRKADALALLNSEAKRLGSSALSVFVSRVSADPFTKVKKLIQQLIERLLREAASEASKKGFCDTELGKAEKDRDYRYEEVKKLNAELATLEAKEAQLKGEGEVLKSSIAETSDALGKATKLRGDEKAMNLEDIAKAKEGLAAVKEAIEILRAFYKKAGKATVLLQASPVDEDTEGPGFEGAYKGKQEQATGIIGILEVIASDFERTLRTTTRTEEKAHADFVLFDRSSKADVGGKSTKKELNEQDIAETESSIAKKMEDLATNQGLLDDALKTIEELKPTCIDTGMSYEERVAKREEEITALKKALCILDDEGVEPECA